MELLSERKHEVKKRYVIGILVILLFTILQAVCMWRNTKPIERIQPDSNASGWEGAQELDKRKTEVKQIAIPGFESMVFKKDQKLQRVNLYNPKSNECLIVFVLYIDDQEMWRSGYCAPDNGYYEIELNEPLEEGVYEAKLLHKCFKENGAVLNSASIKFNLYVQ